jgi:RNA polymerase sigma factor (sigma-70 family)
VGRGEEGQATWSGEDRAGCAGLVREHGPAVHAYLARRAGRQVADDLFGEVWLRAWRSRASYDPSAGEVLPWLIGIARNSLRAHFRLRADHVGRPFELACDPWSDRPSAEANAQYWVRKVTTRMKLRDQCSWLLHTVSGR